MSEQRTPDGAQRVSELLLERYALGELPDGLRRDLERRIADDAELRARLEALRASNTAFLERLPADAVTRTLQNRRRVERAEAAFDRARTRRSARFGLPPAWANVALGAVVIALVSLPVWKPATTGSLSGTEVTGVSPTSPDVTVGPSASPPLPARADGPAAGAGHGRPADAPPPTPSPVAPAPPPQASNAPDDGTRIKGIDPGLALFRRTEHGAEALKPGAWVRPGDELRIGYRSGGFPYGAIFSVDGNGSVTRHWPQSGDSAGRLEAGEPLLPNAFRLDAAPEFERFYLLVSKAPFALAPIPESLHAGQLPELHDLRAVRFELRKDLKDPDAPNDGNDLKDNGI